MVIKADHERIKTLLKDTITLLCRNGLSFKTEFSVEALIGITLDKEDVVLVSINEIIRSELGAKLAMAKAAEEKASERSEEHGDSGESPPCTPASTTNGRQYRKRKHSAGHGSQPNSPEDSHHSEGMDSEDRSYRKMSAGGMLGEESSSEPLNKKGIGESKLHPVKIKEDDTKDVVYIKEEIDTGDWPGGTQTQDSYSDANIQSAGTSNTQNDDNFDFLQSGSLVPVSSDSGPHQSWPDLMQSQATPSGVNISQSKLSSTMTGTVSGSQSDHSQQTVFGRKSQLDGAALQTAQGGRIGLVEQMLGDAVVQHQSSTSASSSLSSSCAVLTAAERQGQLSTTDLSLLTRIDAFPDLVDKMAPRSGLAVKTEVDCRRDADIPTVASNVEVQQVNTVPFPAIDAQNLVDPDFFAGIQLPTRRDFSDPNFTATCPVCEKPFSTYQGFMRHVDHHRGRYAFSCCICGRGFMTKDHMGNHMRGHTGERLYCFCGAGFKTHQALRMHKKREHHDYSVTHEEKWPAWSVSLSSDDKS